MVLFCKIGDTFISLWFAIWILVILSSLVKMWMCSSSVRAWCYSVRTVVVPLWLEDHVNSGDGVMADRLGSWVTLSRGRQRPWLSIPSCASIVSPPLWFPSLPSFIPPSLLPSVGAWHHREAHCHVPGQREPCLGWPQTAKVQATHGLAPHVCQCVLHSFLMEM